MPKTIQTINLISDFNEENDGWEITGGANNLNYVSTGGNAGGYLSWADVDGGTCYWRAPEEYALSLGAFYNGTISFDLFNSDSDLGAAQDIVIKGPRFDLVIDAGPSPGTTWTNYSIELSTKSAWRIDSIEGALATEAEIREVLYEAQDIFIRAEYYSYYGGENGGFDNFSISKTSVFAIKEATSGDDQLVGSNETLVVDTMYGLEGNDSVYGLGGDDDLRGGEGNDLLDGGTGADTLEGGDGSDTYIVDNPFDIVYELKDGGGIDIVKSSINYLLDDDVENLLLTGSNDLDGFGNSRINSITGNDAENSLDGLAGADTLIGLGGNDTYYIDNIGDRIVEESDKGTDAVFASVSYTLAGYVENLTLIGTAAINGAGNTLANTITGNGAANVLNGGAGADTLIGGGGGDSFYVDTASDRIIEAAGGGYDTVYASASYTLNTGQEIEQLRTNRDAGTAALNLTGNAFANKIVGNAGANVLDGGGGIDALYGEAGNDTYLVDNAGDQVFEGAGKGTDAVSARVSYTLAAGQEIEELRAASKTGVAALVLTGNGIDNKIVANAGNNVLNGKGGADILYGLSGQDTFVFDTALGSGNVDRIADFSAADDSIQLSKAIFTALSGGTLAEEAFKDLSVSGATVDADDRILYNKTTGALSYDADGSGSKAAVQFAIVDTKVTLTNADFFVV